MDSRGAFMAKAAGIYGAALDRMMDEDYAFLFNKEKTVHIDFERTRMKGLSAEQMGTAGTRKKPRKKRKSKK